MSLCPTSLSLQQNPEEAALVCSLAMRWRGTREAYQDLGFHRWPVDEVGLLVDHDRLGDGRHARASWRLWTWAECLARLV